MQIVAESGSLHKGNIQAALSAIDAAIDAGANSWKGIMSNPGELIADKSLRFNGKLLYDVINSYRLTDNEWREIGRYCKDMNIDFYCSIGTSDYIPLAVEVGCSQLKAGAWDCRNYFLFDAMLETGLPLQFDLSCVIDGEVDNLVYYLKNKNPNVEISFLYESHGALNLASILHLRKRYPDFKIGFSAEGKDSKAEKIAILYGAEILEKRLTPFTNTEGHHQDKALNPKEFKEWVKKVRDWEEHRVVLRIEEEDKELIGKEGLYPSLEDVEQKQLWLTSLCFSKDVKAGEVITRDMLCAKRPGNGLSPLYSYLFLNKVLTKDVKEDETITYESIKDTVNVSNS